MPHKTQCLLHGLLYKLLDCLVENFLLEESWDSTKANDADARMRQIFKYIEQNFRYNASLSGLAESMYMSASTLSRFFKKQTGVYFAEYINQMRLKYALGNCCILTIILQGLRQTVDFLIYLFLTVH